MAVRLPAAAAAGPREWVPYSTFENYLHAHRLKKATVSGSEIDATLDSGQDIATVPVPSAIAAELQRNGVEYSGSRPSDFSPWLWTIGILAFGGLLMLLARQGPRSAGATTSMGKSKARVYSETGIRTTFGDVAGVDEAKDELQEIVAFLRDPSKYGRLGAHVPKGVLLVGPPGTGKTMLARAAAGEAGVPFLSINGSEFVEMFVGVGAARVRDLFEQGHKKAPAIIFIDEIDAIGTARGAASQLSRHDEREQTLNQLLSEVDGFDPSVGLVLLAATNRPEILDPALLRAGRFDRQVLVDRPDKPGRRQILEVYLRKITIAPDVCAEDIAAMTPGFTGADLATLVNEAAIIATRRDASEVKTDDFSAAIERIVAGLEKRNRLLSPKERKIVAYHEMGHALLSLLLPGVDRAEKVSIIPRGVGALGYTMQRPTEDRFLLTEQELENKMAVLLGGRAAERLVFGEISTGAADDLAKAADIARSIATQYGMVPSLGEVAYDRQQGLFLNGGSRPSWLDRNYAEETAREIDCAVRLLVARAAERAESVLKSRRDALERGAKVLLERETLSAAELQELVFGSMPKVVTVVENEASAAA
jgi:cell division protease FtsH